MKTLLCLDFKYGIFSSWKIIVSYFILFGIASFLLLFLQLPIEEFTDALLSLKFDVYQNPIVSLIYLLTSFVLFLLVLKVFVHGLDKNSENIFLRVDRSTVLKEKLILITLLSFFYLFVIYLLVGILIFNYYHQNFFTIAYFILFSVHYLILLCLQLSYLLCYILSRIYLSLILPILIGGVVYLIYFTPNIHNFVSNFIPWGIFTIVLLGLISFFYQRNFIQIYENVNGGNL